MKPSYDDNLLRGYLLGGLSEAETEICDELSFTDDAFVLRLQTIEDDLVDAYVQGQLSSVEFGQFESYYLVSPRRREKVNFARSLQTIAAQQILVAPARESAAAVSVQQTTREAASWWQSWRTWFALPQGALQWGLATTASLFLLLGGWLLVEIERLHEQLTATHSERAAVQTLDPDLPPSPVLQQPANAQQIAQLHQELDRAEQQLKQLQRRQKLAARQAKPVVPDAPPNLQHVELRPVVRGNEPVALTLSARTDYAILQLKTPEDDVQTYQVEVLTEDQQLRWRSGLLKARTNGTTHVLDVRVRAKLLSPGTYFVQLKGRALDGQVENLRSYALKVVKPTSP